LNESGTISMKRLQRIMDEMTLWEREVFEKEYADLNWFKSKQSKHVKNMEAAKKRSQLGSYSYNLFSVFRLTRSNHPSANDGPAGYI